MDDKINLPPRVNISLNQTMLNQYLEPLLSNDARSLEKSYTRYFSIVIRRGPVCSSAGPRLFRAPVVLIMRAVFCGVDLLLSPESFNPRMNDKTNPPPSRVLQTRILVLCDS